MDKKKWRQMILSKDLLLKAKVPKVKDQLAKLDLMLKVMHNKPNHVVEVKG